EECVPRVFGELAAGQPVHGDAVGQGIAAFATDGLALARRERGEEFIETAVVRILPVELLVGAAQEAAFAEELAFRFGGEGDVNAGSLVDPAELDQACGERLAGDIGARLDQEAASGGRRERHGDLEFWIIVAAGALIGLVPSAVVPASPAPRALDRAG